MAEYNMSYEEVKEFIDDLMQQPEVSDRTRQYRAEILAALTAKDDVDNNDTAVKESVELWKNQIGTPSELLLGTRYIIVKDCLLDFIRMAMTSGVLDALFLEKLNTEAPMSGVSIAVVSSVVFGLVDLFGKVSKLEDYDFCVYFQAAWHFRRNGFTLEDMLEWFPHGEKDGCNMCNSLWRCEHILENDICGMLQESRLLEALRSLEKKGILRSERRTGQVFYFFAW